MKLKNIIALLLGIVASTFFSSCSCTHDGEAGELDVPMDSVFGAIFDARGKAPGAIVMLSRGDSLIYSRTFGYADLARSVPVTDSTMFNIVTLTQQFTAAGVMRLAEEGLLSIEDSLPKFIPTFTRPCMNKVRLRHILSHSSGIPDNRPRTEQEWQSYIAHANGSKFGRLNDYMLFSRSDETRYSIREVDTLSFEPGSQYHFSCPPYEMMSYVIPVASGINFEPWMHSNIFDRAGMKHVIYFHQEAYVSNASHGYRPARSDASGVRKYGTGGAWEEYDYGEAPFFPSWPDGGMYTTGPDMMKWLTAFENDSIISAQSRLACWTPYVRGDKENVSVGFGVYIQLTPGMARKIFAGGVNGGYSAYAASFPDRRVRYLILSNRPDWDRDKAAQAVDSILAARRWI